MEDLSRLLLSGHAINSIVPEQLYYGHMKMSTLALLLFGMARCQNLAFQKPNR
jgi:hypothetical protein